MAWPRVRPPDKRIQRPDRSLSINTTLQTHLEILFFVPFYLYVATLPLRWWQRSGLRAWREYGHYHCYHYCCHHTHALPSSGNPNNLCRGRCKTVMRVVRKRCLESPAGGLPCLRFSPAERGITLRQRSNGEAFCGEGTTKICELGGGVPLGGTTETRCRRQAAYSHRSQFLCISLTFRCRVRGMWRARSA